MDQTLMERVLLASIEEQRRARRWRNFWRAVWAAIVITVIWAGFLSTGTSTGVHPTSRHTALVNLSGVIDAEANANAESITLSLREAFGNQSAAGVILRINYKRRVRAGELVLKPFVSARYDAIAVVGGIVLWAVILMWLHELLIGVAPLAM